MRRSPAFSSGVRRQPNIKSLSTEAPKLAATEAVKSASASASAGVKSAANVGSTLFQRLTAFLAGTAVGFGANFYLVHEELLESNKRFERTLQDIQKKIA